MAKEWAKLGKRLSELKGETRIQDLALAARKSKQAVLDFFTGNFEPIKTATDVVMLARAFNDDVTIVSDLVGISLTPDCITQADELIEDRKQKRRIGKPQRVFPGDPRNILGEIARFTEPRVRISRVRQIRKASEDFYVDYVEAIIHVINPTWHIDDHYKYETEHEQISRLYAIPHACHIAPSLIETLDRVADGINFVPVPGLRNRQAGVGIGAKGSSRISWADFIHKRGDGKTGLENVLAVTTKGDAGNTLLQSRMFHTIKEVETHDLTAISGRVNELLKPKNTRVMYFGAEDICMELFAKWDGEGQDPYFVTPESTNKIGLPTFNAGLAIWNDPTWRSLLERATEHAFRIIPDRLAQIYGGTLREYLRKVPKQLGPRHGLAVARLFDLRIEDGREFLKMLYDLLLKSPDGDKFPKSLVTYTLEEAIRAEERRHGEFMKW